MKKQWLSRFVIGVLLIAFLMPITTYAAKDVWNVEISDVDYYVELDKSTDVFICNKKSIGSEVGTEYYMTYTVESMAVKEYRQQGIIGTNVPTQSYPYVTGELGGGLYKYDVANKMLVEGNTYFLKFVVTKDGYKYRAAWAKDAKSKYIEFEQEYGEVKTDLGYFGLWLGDMEMSGKLTKVRFYDKKGNDLGAQITASRNATVYRETPISKDNQVEHSYKITLEDARNVAISNNRVATSDKVYLEYKVESSNSHVYQSGVILSNAPKAGYPYENGYLWYEQLEHDPKKVGNGPLLVPGAEYLLVFEKREDALSVTIQQSYKGKVSEISFPMEYGTYYKDAEYFSIWMGAGDEFPINCVLTDVKCYDSNKNNLGVQCNQVCKIEHFGELEDYSGCEAMYYCEKDSSLYALYADKVFKHTADSKTTEGTYRIEDSVITLTQGKQKDIYDFLYLYFKNDSGKQYDRLHTYKAVFETGKGSKVEDQVISAETGYTVMKPTDPTLEGNKFMGWYTKDGNEYDFDTLATDSITLYARWDEVTYADAGVSDMGNILPYVAVGAAVLILIGAVAGGMGMIRRGKRNGSEK